MGGPKARLLVEGEPLALLHARRAKEAGCARVIVVARPEDVPWLATEGGLTAEGAFVIGSSAPDPSGSLAIGARALGQGSGLVLITPVDALPARLETIAALAASLAAGADAAVPSVGIPPAQRGGHPVLVRASALAPYRTDTFPILRELLSSLGDRCVRVPVDDPAVAMDLDAPEDVLRLTGEGPRFA